MTIETCAEAWARAFYGSYAKLIEEGIDPVEALLVMEKKKSTVGGVASLILGRELTRQDTAKSLSEEIYRQHQFNPLTSEGYLRMSEISAENYSNHGYGGLRQRVTAATVNFHLGQGRKARLS